MPQQEQPAPAVSIHAPVMGANSQQPHQVTLYCFNPRTRDGCEKRPLIGAFFGVVSIHAPVMGAKCSYTVPQFIVNVSIHAPVMGANSRLGFA